jgi:hypothetical protein
MTLLSTIGFSLRAQTRASAASPRVVSSIDVSATAVTYADSLRANGASVTPAFRLDWPRATVGGSASITRLSQGGTTAQASLAPSVFTPSAGVFTAELAGAFGGSTHSDGSRTGQLLGLGRLYAIGPVYGAWAGGGGGRTWDGVVWRTIRQAEIGAWMNRSETTVLASFTPIIVQDTIRYADLQSALRYPSGAFELGVTAGVRMGASSPAIGGSSRTWGNVSLMMWLSRQIAVVGSAGSYPVDLTQGYPGGRFVSVALRFASSNTRLAERDDDSPNTAGEPSAANNSPAFAVRTPVAGSTRRELRVLAPSARTVEITGDFTRWRPVRLTRQPDGWWTVSQDLAIGTYQMNVRIDGGAWFAPAGLLATRDEFGGLTGILTIE